MNENELNVVKDYKFDNPLLTDADSIIENCFNACSDNYFHEFKYQCLFDFSFKTITNNELFNLIVIDEELDEDSLNIELKVVRQNEFIFIQLNKLTIKFPSHLQYINVS